MLLSFVKMLPHGLHAIQISRQFGLIITAQKALSLSQYCNAIKRAILTILGGMTDKYSYLM